MSNTEFVMVPRGLLERLDLGKNTAVAMAALTELRALLSQPAQQHPGGPGGPVALPERRDPLFVVGSAYDDGLCVGFNECLDEIAKLGPLYPHADPGEVDQLSQVIRDLNDERDEIGAEVGRLRAQAADLKRRHDALHRDMATIAGREVPKGVTVSDYAAAAIADALSGSAGPCSTAWGCGPCKVEMADKRPCDLCGAEPSAPIETLCASELGFHAENGTCSTNKITKHIKGLGITYFKFLVDRMGDSIWLFNCRNVPEELPEWLERKQVGATDWIGRGGMTEELAKEIEDESRKIPGNQNAKN